MHTCQPSQLLTAMAGINNWIWSMSRIMGAWAQLSFDE